MKHFACLLLALLAWWGWSSPACGQSVYYYSYCDGLWSSSGVNGRAGAKTVEAAICIPKEELSPLAGASITSIRFALSTTNYLGGVTVWVREGSLQAANAAEAAAGGLARGWNEAQLAVPYAITGNEDLYCGYSFEQEGEIIKCISLVSGIQNDNSCWVGNDGTWVNYANQGALSLEVGITGENLPQHDLVISNCAADNDVLSRNEDVLSIRGEVANAGMQTVNGFDITCTVNGKTYSDHYDDVLEYRDRTEFYFVMFAREIAEGYQTPVEITVSAAGATDETPGDNTQTITVTTYDEAFDRTLLLEEFTTENCQNCPAGAERLKEALTDEYAERVVWVCHHAAFGTDWLTIPESEQYLWFFGGSNFAPSVMLDRTHFDIEENTRDYAPMSIFEPDVMQRLFDLEMDEKAFASVEATAVYDDNGRAEVTVKGEKTPVFDQQAPGARLTVFLLEDGIQAQYQMTEPPYPGGSDYVHENVVRAVPTGAWGVPVEWDGDTFEAAFNFSLDDNWQRGNLKAVAFLHTLDEADRNACRVLNATQCPVEKGTTGIESAHAGSKTVARRLYYSAEGILLDRRPERGFYIERTLYRDGTEETRKAFR